MSQYVVGTYVNELMGAAFGYLLKDRVSQIDLFLDAVSSVANGGTVVDPDVIQQLLVRASARPVDALTARESDVLALMAQGMSNSAIAAELVISLGAVEKHTQRIFAKLALHPDGDQHRRVIAVLTWLADR